MREKKFNELKEMANAIRSLTLDAIENAQSGHPGMPLGMADVATSLFTNFLKFDASSPDWKDRDRFVLSAGHGSMLIYALSYLLGYKDTNLKQLKQFRQIGSKTAGHPEFGLLKCIETTTGPLGQGIANAVGMALSEKFLNQKYGDSLVNHKTFVIAGDGCLMEGISQESISLAGHHNLKKLIVLFDDNEISIDGKTSLTESDNQIKRFEASNWDAFKIDGHNFEEIFKALKYASNNSKPTLICCKTLIGYGSPNKAGSESCHGSPLGEIESKLTKQNLDCNWKKFQIPKHILKLWRKIGNRNISKRLNWEKKLKQNNRSKEFIHQFKKVNYKRNSIGKNYLKKILNTVSSEATRKSSQNSINILSSNISNFMGGSADLTGSNLTKIENSQIRGKKTNYIHYGVREHLMAAAMNGIALHGGYIPYGGTFLIFSDYCKNAIRLSALMRQQVIYVFTHDSIGLGEDGPTHQPVEQLAGLRAIPNLNVLRPCDAVETFECWEMAIMEINCPSVIVLSRQSLPLIRAKVDVNKSISGGYFIKKKQNSKITLIATGSEVSLLLKIENILSKKDIICNIVSMPCFEKFDVQSEIYKNKILGKNPIVAIEAGSSQVWYKYLKKDDLVIGLDQFGESGKGLDVFKHFGFEENDITNRILERFF